MAAEAPGRAADTTTREAGATDAPHASTTPQATTVASPTHPILSDEQQECVDAFMTYLEDIEDVVDGFDFAGATLLEYQDVVVKLCRQDRRSSIGSRACTATC